MSIVSFRLAYPTIANLVIEGLKSVVVGFIASTCKSTVLVAIPVIFAVATYLNFAHFPTTP